MVNKTNVERELLRLKKEVDSLRSRSRAPTENRELEGKATSWNDLVRYLIQDREQTNRLLAKLSDRITGLEHEIDKIEVVEQTEVEQEAPVEYQAKKTAENREVPLSALDVKIMNFIQSQPGSMACADDVRLQMGYKGRNAACSRLTRLSEKGLLQRVQLGHKAFYKYDAGKTTNTLIISPPQ